MNLYFKELGEGQPLVILHGLFGSSDNWLTISKLFAQHFRVILVDQRNHGFSPHTTSHTYQEMAEDLKAFLDDLNIVNPVLLGHSMGGKTVMKFVTAFPQYPVDKMIIVDIAPRSYDPHHQKYITALQAIDLQKIQTRQEADNIMAAFVPNLGERQFLLKNLSRDADGNFFWRMNLPVLIRDIENIGEGLTRHDHSEVEALFVKGGRSDYYIKREDAAFIHEVFPHSKIKTIENAGHWVQAEQPEIFYDLVMGFLRQGN